VGSVNTRRFCVEDTENRYKVSVGKLSRKKSFVGRSRRWEDNIKIGLRETGSKSLDSIHRAQCKDQWPDLVNAVIKILVP
jgi:hypothetical protein